MGINIIHRRLSVSKLIVNILDGRKTNSFEKSTKVLVDVFRSTSTMPIMLMRGVPKIIPTASIREARSMKRENPDYLVIGERYGMKVPGFDMNNSPSDALEFDLWGKISIFTSTNGTMVLRKIASTGKVYISSFINYEATAAALKDEERVDIIVSNRPDGPADEDYIYAEFLKETLTGGKPDFSLFANRIRDSKGSRRLKLMGAKRDIEASLMLNYCNSPVVFDGKYIIKVE